LQSEFGHFASLYHQAKELSPPPQGVLNFLEEYLAKNIVSVWPPAAPSNNSPRISESSTPFSFPDGMISLWNDASMDFIVAVVSSEHYLSIHHLSMIKPRGSSYILRTEYARSLILRELVASYCNHNKVQLPDDVDSTTGTAAAAAVGMNAESFGILTQYDYIPVVTFLSAKLLLQLEKHYRNANNNISNDASLRPPPFADSNNSALHSCLQERCLNSLMWHHSLIDTTKAGSSNEPGSSEITDETLKILGAATLLSAPAVIKFSL
jgi:hypothetical protein